MIHPELQRLRADFNLGRKFKALDLQYFIQHLGKINKSDGGYYDDNRDLDIEGECPSWDQFLGSCNYINLCRARLLSNLDSSWAEAFSHSIQGRKCDNINRGIGHELDQAIEYTKTR